ncbi:hypothetical protein, partial [Aeromonas caviae]
MPSEPSVIRFYVALLAAMGAPLRPRPRLPEMEQLALAVGLITCRNPGVPHQHAVLLSKHLET